MYPRSSIALHHRLGSGTDKGSTLCCLLCFALYNPWHTSGRNVKQTSDFTTHIEACHFDKGTWYSPIQLLRRQSGLRTDKGIKLCCLLCFAVYTCGLQGKQSTAHVSSQIRPLDVTVNLTADKGYKLYCLLCFAVCKHRTHITIQDSDFKAILTVESSPVPYRGDQGLVKKVSCLLCFALYIL